MYNQKFNPYGQFPSKGNQLYEQEYQEEDSQPLVQEIDDNYEPTEKQVRQYAMETLGMSLPEDQAFLYLARQGLIAPLPNNWVPYQSKNGEVYYKHRITQQKTFQHPTDIEYRKMYEQQKQKMARKNLKSMNLKASNQGLISNSNSFVNASSNIFGSKLNPSNILGINQTHSAISVIKLDPKIEQRYEQQLAKLEKKLKNDFISFQEQETALHQKKLRNLKEDYEKQLQKIYKSSKNEIRLEDKLKEQKENIKKKLKSQLEDDLQNEIKDHQRGLQTQFRQFQNIYQEDNTLKKNKYQTEKDEEFFQRERRFKDFINRNNQVKENKKRQRQQILKKLKKQLEDSKNEEIEHATTAALQQQLLNIQTSYQKQIQEKKAQLQREYNETRKILGFDQTAYLSQIATKKSRIKAISLQKIQSYKKKEIQMLNAKAQNQYEQELKSIKSILEKKHEEQIKDEHKRQEERLVKMKEKLDKEYKAKHQSQVQNIYSDLKLKIRAYESQMNKKISNIQDQFINDIYGKTKHMNKDITIKIQLKEKEMLIQNKNTIINSLKRQTQLEKVTFQLLKLQSQLHLCKDAFDIDEKLLKLSKKYELSYKPQRYMKYEQIYKEFRVKYKKDKQFLVSVMNSLQSSKVYSPGVGSATILKQYNQDVRAMRQNEQNLKAMQILLKKAEMNDKLAIEQLQKFNFVYTEIDMRKQMSKASDYNLGQMQELQQQTSNKNRRPLTSSNNSRDIESALKNHSTFLSNARTELNRKLYQIRNNSYY